MQESSTEAKLSHEADDAVIRGASHRERLGLLITLTVVCFVMSWVFIRVLNYSHERIMALVSVLVSGIFSLSGCVLFLLAALLLRQRILRGGLVGVAIFLLVVRLAYLIIGLVLY